MMEVTDQVYNVPVSEIFLDTEFNCRKFINPMDCDSLARDIKAQGLSQPITVQPYDKDGFKYRVLMGHRRLVAVRDLNKSTHIKAMIRTDAIDDLTAIIMNVNENLQRKELDIGEEAQIVGKLHSRMTREEVSSQLKMSTGWVQTRYMFYNLPDYIQREFVKQNFKTSEVRKIYKIYNECEFGDFSKLNMYVKALKEGKANPEAVLKAKKKASRSHDKRIRSRQEIQILMDHIRTDGRGACIVTRALAWASGNISNGDLDIDLKNWHEEEGFSYTPFCDDGSGDYD